MCPLVKELERIEREVQNETYRQIIDRMFLTMINTINITKAGEKK